MIAHQGLQVLLTLLEQLIQQVAGALGHGLGGHSHRHLHRSAVGRAEGRQSGRVNPVIQPAQLAVDHLLGQRADLGAVELIDVVVGRLPVGGGVGLCNRGGCTIAVAVWNPVPALRVAHQPSKERVGCLAWKTSISCHVVSGSTDSLARYGRTLPSLQLFPKEDLAYAASVDPRNKSALGETHVAMPRLRLGFIGLG